MALQHYSRLLSLFYISHTERRCSHFYEQTWKENPNFKKLSGQTQRSKLIWFSLQNNLCYQNGDGQNSYTQRSSQREIRDSPSDNADCTKKPERVKKFSERGHILKSRDARVIWSGGGSLKTSEKSRHTNSFGVCGDNMCFCFSCIHTLMCPCSCCWLMFCVKT